ncbi:conserved hypothetical protein [Histoplasma capsulatum G186AR]|uniref:Uncharacterized protein n=1 Tax=Ajellomyces capsulatus (strain G186AR / H82 / ATCC MYA-2454 / RMSCC 2432) TaxID=447093 RepID=C0ND26_AJECG|nr:uncharacterized protein HCBG_01022 [Histoplasma capsulatum G186AR]EEH11567.1 conserved hypothetical protein [Histoplasma capsulatum G186AR]
MPPSIKSARKFLFGVPWTRVLPKVKGTSRGHRLYPSQTPKNDSKKNYRLDKGSVVNGKHEIILQANKNAEDSSVREAANKNSHAILAKVVYDPENNPNGDGVPEALLASFKGENKDEDKAEGKK